MAAKIKNISSWRLNKAEEKELAERVKKGEEELTVRRELQQAKAEASAKRKSSANAVASKCQQQQQPPQKKGAGAPAVAAPSSGSEPVDDCTNTEYYALVQQDLQTIFTEFGKAIVDAKPVPIKEGSGSGVQEVYDHKKGLIAFQQHGVYRASISAFAVNPLSPATPGVPMSRKRVSDLSLFHYGETGEPKFVTDRFIELACSQGDLTENPRNLQMVSPEELLHSMLHGCALAIKYLCFTL